MKKSSFAERAYRLLLRFLPFDFQREFGSEMQDVFRQERGASADGGRLGSLSLWWRTLAGFLSTGFREHMDVLRRDVKYGMRSLGDNPMFTAMAIVALGIGIGANLTIFGFANALLLRPLPVRDAGRVVQIFHYRWSNIGYGDYLRYRDQNRTVSGLSISALATASVKDGGPPEAFTAMAVSGDYFESLGLPAAIGRNIGTDDDQQGAPGVVMLAHRFWQRRYGGDMGVLGRRISVGGSPFTIIGVTAAGFQGTMTPLIPDIWIPWNSPHHSLVDSGELTGRLRPGISLTQAQADLGTIAAAIGNDLGERLNLTVYPARMLHPEVTLPVMAFVGGLMTLAVLALLIACLNIANLSLARASARQSEFGVRIALGAGRSQLIRQALTESLMLSCAGTAAAIAASLLVSRAVRAIPIPLRTPLPAALEFQFLFDCRAVLFAIVLTFGAALLFGIAPALQTVRANVLAALKESVAAGRRRSRFRAACIVTQLGASTVLLVMAALLVRSVDNARRADRGFDSAGILIADLGLQNADYVREQGLALLERLQERLEHTADIVSVNIAEQVPLTLANSGGLYHGEAGAPATVSQNVISYGHFRTLGIPLLAGRDFTPADVKESPPVGIVNERLARRFWPNENPLGQRLRSGNGPWIEVVGVARDSKYVGMMENPRLFLYRPIGQRYGPRDPVSLLVKTRGDPFKILPPVRDAVRELDPAIALFNIQSLDEAAKISLIPVSVAAGFAGVLGSVALILAIVGIYGVVSYLAHLRTREIAIRIALGARPVQVVRDVTREALRWTLWGLLLGLTAALALARIVRDWTFGVGPADPVSFVGIAIALSLTACAAAWIPARRAAAADPSTALKEE